MTNLIIRLIPLLIAVESRGNPTARGDNGASVGILQIQAGCIQDVNRIYKTNYTWPKHALNAHTAQKICHLYLAYWGEQYERVIGRKASMETLARIWNGGPNGWNKRQTQKYWRKVKRLL